MYGYPVNPGPGDREPGAGWQHHDAAARAAADPATDNPVDALIRHNITVHNSPAMRFGHNLLLVLMVGFGIGFVIMGIYFLASGGGWLAGGMPILVGVFLAVWGPVARRIIAADTARKTAAMEYQLHQVKTARFRDGTGF
ncbi:hypothetical protein [Actinoplanes sp. NPDC049118]|uniref:hypothetical protein n=1 Tax=Actinoplanes sp. NPDC049118 TaxID=3155769 RepID=UPI0033D694E3